MEYLSAGAAGQAVRVGCGVPECDCEWCREQWCSSGINRGGGVNRGGST